MAIATMKPVVSICIANYNGIPIISECLDSVFAQQGDIPVEIIVHDDASTDGSVEFLRRNYPGIRLIESESNVGFCVSNNRMAEAANGEYLLLLNNDAALFPDAIVSLLAKAKDINESAILGLPQYDADSGELLDVGSLLDPFLNPIPNLEPTRTEVGMVMGACLWIPRSLWQSLGGFPEWFGSVGEDLYLCCIARLKGYPVAAAASSGYLHYVGR
ncbi:MAG TPA: glycosyltransferase, partial [Methylophilaceae bacterium]|nr:glycosyltransferase [Methylophilaceae bacterium]